MAKIIEAPGNLFSAPPGSVLIHSCNCVGEWGSGIAKEFKKRYPLAYSTYNNHCTTLPTNSSDTLDAYQHFLLGTTLLIPPDNPDASRSSVPLPTATPKATTSKEIALSPYWIACLFTSFSYGRKTPKKKGVDAPHRILANTETAMADLERQLERLRSAVHASSNGDNRSSADILVELQVLDSGKGGERREECWEQKREASTQQGNRQESVLDKRVVIEMPGACYAPRINSGGFHVGWEDTRRVLERGKVDVKVLVREEEEWEGRPFDGGVVSVVGGAGDQGGNIQKEDGDDYVSVAETRRMRKRKSKGGEARGGGTEVHKTKRRRKREDKSPKL